MTKFNFDNHRTHKRNYKTLLRFVMYGVVIIVLLYLIMSRSKPQESNPRFELLEIEGVEIEEK